MHRVINIILLALFICSITSCRQSLKAPAYASYITDRKNGLKKVSVVDGWEFCMQYRPYDYIMLQETKGVTGGYNFDKRKVQLQGTAWFTIAIKRMGQSITPLRYGITSQENYDTRLNYYLNDAKEDVKLIYGKDTLKPISYLFENNYNLSPQETIVVGFYLPSGEEYPRKNMRLSFIDRVFKSGIINAEYADNILQHLPTLKY